MKPISLNIFMVLYVNNIHSTGTKFGNFFGPPISGYNEHCTLSVGALGLRWTAGVNSNSC